jgi:hypothetical protein
LPVLFCLSSALGSETGFLLWGEEKARIRAFFLSRSALSLFFALLRSFFGFALASAKARKREKSASAHLCSLANGLAHL